MPLVGTIRGLVTSVMAPLSELSRQGLPVAIAPLYVIEALLPTLAALVAVLHTPALKTSIVHAPPVAASTLDEKTTVVDEPPEAVTLTTVEPSSGARCSKDGTWAAVCPHSHPLEELP